jgi:hypothetical protein
MKIDNLDTISKAGHGLITFPNVIGVFLNVCELSIIKMNIAWRIRHFGAEETAAKSSDEINESYSSLQGLHRANANIKMPLIMGADHPVKESAIVYYNGGIPTIKQIQQTYF